VEGGGFTRPRFARLHDPILRVPLPGSISRAPRKGSSLDTTLESMSTPRALTIRDLGRVGGPITGIPLEAARGKSSRRELPGAGDALWVPRSECLGD
jgi:hypothetical protein